MSRPKKQNWAPPQAVADIAELLRANVAGTEKEKILDRLIADDRMKIVWDYLGSENNYVYLHSSWAKTNAAPVDSSTSDQDCRAEFFVRIWDCVQHSSPLTRASVLADIRRFNEAAAALRVEVDFLGSMGFSAEVDLLNQVIQACEDEAINRDAYLDDDDPTLIDRDRGRTSERTFVIELSLATATIFNQPLPSILARVANVVFNRDDIERLMVKEWLSKVRW